MSLKNLSLKTLPSQSFTQSSLSTFFPSTSRTQINPVYHTLPYHSVKPQKSNITDTTFQSTLTGHQENLPFLDDFTDQKHKQHFRFISNNINTIRPYRSWAKWEHGLLDDRNYHIDGIAIQETNIVWTLTNVKKAVTALKQNFSGTTLTTCNSNDTALSDNLPGGALLAIVGRYAGRKVSEVRDHTGLGRWTGQKLRCKGDRHVVFLSAYRPTKNTGPSTTYSQHLNLMGTKYGPRPDPRRQMLQDLASLINGLQGENTDIVLAWDVTVI